MAFQKVTNVVVQAGPGNDKAATNLRNQSREGTNESAKYMYTSGQQPSKPQSYSFFGDSTSPRPDNGNLNAIRG